MNKGFSTYYIYRRMQNNGEVLKTPGTESNRGLWLREIYFLFGFRTCLGK